MSEILPRKLLVVVENEALVGTDHGPLLTRAVDLAKRARADLYLLRVCFERSLGYGPFAAREDIDQARKIYLDEAAAGLDAFCKTLSVSARINCGTEVRWSDDLSAAVLAAARECGADLIMKRCNRDRYVLGLAANTDWDLLRQSEVPVWFVAESSDLSPASGIIAAIDQVAAAGEGDAHFRLDHALFSYAKRLSDIYESRLFAAHAYELPATLFGHQGYGPIIAPSTAVTPEAVPIPTREHELARREIAERHGRAVQSFVDEHGIPLDDLIIAEGPVDKVLETAAAEKGAGLIVMGAAHKDRWDRFLHRVSAEPVLAETDRDVLFVKPA